MKKPAAVQFVAKGNFVLTRLDVNLCSEIQGYQMTHALVNPELKLSASKIVKKISKLQSFKIISHKKSCTN